MNATEEHIESVKRMGKSFCCILEGQLTDHDLSKLIEPECSAFLQASNLKDIEYGSEEYAKSLKDLKVALEHHYALNRHHPEHFKNGISGMNLIDVCEMFLDWYASTKRVKNGDIRKSIVQNQHRFGFSDDLCSIFLNTVDLLEESK